MFFDILKVGAISCLSPLQTVLTILIFTKILAGFGTETLAGYGMGSRLEFLLVPIAFAFGVASVPMVGMAMGAGLVARARQVAWTAGAAAGLTLGLVGLVVAVDPANCGSRCSPAIPASPPRPILFCARPARPSAFFGMGALPVFLRAGRGQSAAVRCWPAPSRLLIGRDSAAGGWHRRCAGLDAVRAGRRGHGRVRPEHGAVRCASTALGQMTRLLLLALAWT